MFLYVYGTIVFLIISLLGFSNIFRKRNVGWYLLLLMIVVSATTVSYEFPLNYILYLFFLFHILLLNRNKSGGQLNYCLLYLLFFIWSTFELLFSDSWIKGIGMLLKYLMPIMFYIAISKTILTRDMCMSFLDKIISFMPLYVFIALLAFLMGRNYFVSHTYFTMTIFVIPLILYYANYRPSNNKIYIIIYLLCYVTPILMTKRTPILGIGIGTVVFMLLKYKLKALIPMALIIVASISILLSIPSFREKVFYDDFSLNTSSDVEDIGNNINTSGRSIFWAYLLEEVYEDNQIMGAGTGSVKAFIQSPKNENQRYFSLVHNDFLVILCENGLIGLSLFIAFLLRIMFRCFKYANSNNRDIKYMSFGCFSMLIATSCHMFFENCVNSLGLSMLFMFYALLNRLVSLDSNCKSIKVYKYKMV